MSHIELINYLVHEASKKGAQGYEVLGWQPPTTGSDRQEGQLILSVPAPHGGAQLPWYQR